MGKSRHASTVSSSRTAPPHGPRFHLGGGSSNGRRERKGRSFEPGSIQRRGVSIESTPQCIGLGPIAAFIVSDHASTAHCGCSKPLAGRRRPSVCAAVRPPCFNIRAPPDPTATGPQPVGPTSHRSRLATPLQSQHDSSSPPLPSHGRTTAPLPPAHLHHPPSSASSPQDSTLGRSIRPRNRHSREASLSPCPDPPSCLQGARSLP
jgi:hypothetical protein